MTLNLRNNCFNQNSPINSKEKNMKRLLDLLGPHLRYAWVGLAVAALVSVAWAGEATNKSVSAQQQTVSYLYSVKILCVPTLGRAAPALVPGIYQTAVNVHNPWPETANIVKWLTRSEERRVGKECR